MRKTSAGSLLVLCGAVTLAACQDEGLTAPRERGGLQGQVASLSGACNWQQSRAVNPSLGSGADVQRASYPLPLVTVTANFGGFGVVPFNLLQQMNFPRGSGAELAPCLNDGNVEYSVDGAVVADEPPSDPPPGVNADWWRTLSPREQKIVLKFAQGMMELNPGRWQNVGAAIHDLFEDRIGGAKLKGKLGGNDYFSGRPLEAEQFAGGVYACHLYRSFVTDGDWAYSNDETLRMVIELVGGLAESLFPFSPLRGLQFARNGAVGAGLASADGYLRDCARLIFDSIAGGSIIVSDPYSGRGPGLRPPPYTPPENDN